jgi:hypothetical protein
MPDSKVSKAYVRPDNTAVVTCLHCSRQKVILADSFKGHKHKLKFKCVCQNVFTVNLEFRNNIRKKTRLRGTYINHSQKDSVGTFAVINISVTGLGFTSQDSINFKEGDKLTLEFTLDDERKTEISKDVFVRYICQELIGCEFEEREEPYGSPLGYYVMLD